MRDLMWTVALSLALFAGAVRADAVAPGAAFTETMEARVTGVTSIAVDPGGARLYAVTLLGAVLRWRIDPATGALSGLQTLTPPEFETPNGPRSLIGLTFDPEDPLTLWVTDNDPVPRTGSDASHVEFSGRISRIRLAPGDDFVGRVETYVTGLPRSCSDHVTNSLVFRANPNGGPRGPAHLLYVAQGSNSAKGAADARWCWRPERLLGAAILEVDPRRDPPAGGFDVATEPLPDDGQNRRFGYATVLGNILWPGDDGDLTNGGIRMDSGPYAGSWLHFSTAGVATARSGPEANSPAVHAFYDPYAPDAPVRLFATGVRNAYDIVWGADGTLYAPTNGAGGGGRAPDDPRTKGDESIDSLGREQDFMHRLKRGDYAGHPNPLRGEFIVNGGNPTAGLDPNEIAEYAVGTVHDPRYNPAASIPLGHHWSPTGTVMYPETGCAPELCGAVIFANYSKGNNLRAMTFGPDGSVTGDQFLHNAAGQEIAHPDPIDLALGTNGRLYLATMERANGVSRIIRLDPVAPAGGGAVRLRVVDAADPAAVVFRIENLPPEIGPLAVTFDGGETRARVTPEVDGRFVAAIGPAGYAEAVLETGEGANRRTLARAGVLVGLPGPALVLHGVSFAALRANETVTMQPFDLVPHEKDRSSDNDGDGLNDGFIGPGYLGFYGPPGAAAGVSVDIPTAGPHRLTLRLANGSRDPRPIRIETDAGAVTIADTRTGDWDAWEERSATLNLKAGAVEIRLVQVGDAGPIVDLVLIAPQE